MKSKLSGSWQLVSGHLRPLRDGPSRSRCHNLRPARETCEQCHWPNKFVGDRLPGAAPSHPGRRGQHPHEDRARAAGRRAGGPARGQGIHRHVGPRPRRSATCADGKRQTIGDGGGDAPRRDPGRHLPAPWAPPHSSPEASGAAEWRTMDCVDCHNRPTHQSTADPARELDQPPSATGGHRPRAPLRPPRGARRRSTAAYAAPRRGPAGHREAALTASYERGAPRPAGPRPAEEGGGRPPPARLPLIVAPERLSEDSTSSPGTTREPHRPPRHEHGDRRSAATTRSTRPRYWKAISQDCNDLPTPVLAQEEKDPEILRTILSN